MRQVVPSGDFPSNVVPVQINPPEGMEDEVRPAVGLSHRHPENLEETVALEFMFELTEDEIHVLKHEPFLTLTVMADHLHPFALQTSYPPDEKYSSLNEHSHLCRKNLAHEKNRWWQCENPRHDENHQVRECTECWQARTQQEESEVDDDPESPVT